MTSVEKICEKYGKKIKLPSLSSPFVKPEKKTYYSFPDCKALSKARLEDITNMGVGYRDRYIIEAVQDINSGKIDLESLKTKSNEDLYAILTSMFGVGTKVANCTMLFGFGLDRTGLGRQVGIVFVHTIEKVPVLRELVERRSAEKQVEERGSAVAVHIMFFYERTVSGQR